MEKKRTGADGLRVCVVCRQRKRKCDGLRPACSSCVKIGREGECIYESRSKTREQELATKVLQLEEELARANSVLKAGSINDTEIRVPSYSMSGSDGNPQDGSADEKWWEADEIPIPKRDFLITIFLKHAPQFQFDQNVPTFLSRFYTYPPTHRSHPHPSLLNAMYLAASFFLASPAYPPHLVKRLGSNCDPAEAEAAFLRKTRKALASNLAMAENLFDYFLASNLLARYMYYCMRYMEGHLETAGAMRLAMACNLHVVSTPQDLASFPSSILPPPISALEVCDRINAFWSVFIVDRAGSLISGLPLSIPDEEVTTVFPPIASSGAPQFQSGSIASLYAGHDSTCDARYDTLHAMKAKGAAFLCSVRSLVRRAAELGITNLSQAPSSFTTTFHETDAAITKLIFSLPYAPPIPPSSSATTYDSAVAELAMVHTVIRGSLIQLHGPFCTGKAGGESMEKVMVACKEIVAIARALEKTCETLWQVPIHVGWGIVVELYQKELTSLRGDARLLDEIFEEGRRSAIRKLRDDMKFIARMMKRLVNTYRSHRSLLDLHVDILAKDAEFFGESPFPSAVLEDPRSQLLIQSYVSPDKNLQNTFPQSRATGQSGDRPLKWLQWLNAPPKRPSGSHK